ncbi:MAG: sigma 54-interacting transcriptional regulator [Deltaproteobacteria bacterium]|jgi:transcriptional regulator with GAF, ATPase, and Fis domain|nr:sigma 54-interacting transcriptional regulator [Deltaproteobacteria bacterium]
MDTNTFFQKATLSICSTLEIETAMSSCIKVLKQIMPADKMVLECYEHGFSAVRIIALADKSHGEKVDFLTYIPQEMRPAVDECLNITDEEILIYHAPFDDPVVNTVLEKFNIKCTSMMAMGLTADGIRLGGLSLGTEGSEKYTQEHAESFALLQGHFSLAMSNALKHREILELQNLLADDNRYLQGELRKISGEKIIGSNFGLKDVMKHVHLVASMDSPVLLLGETGTGKDVIANAIHYSSHRSSGPFISVNCGAIPDSLIDSELFGHEKGAFTGALAQKRGRFERAHNGTIFLDEIGELPLPAQVRLLKVLQSKSIERVGGTEVIELDIRIIAATNRNLEEMIKNNQFREDLWFRLNVFPINMPPLRNRKSDIPALLQYFINQKARELKLPSIPVLPDNAIDDIIDYNWPGNVRELQNIVERALILNPEGPLDFGHLGFSRTSNKPESEDDNTGIHNLDTMMARHIEKVLGLTNGKIFGAGGASELLGVNNSTLRNRMDKLGIEYKKK